VKDLIRRTAVAATAALAPLAFAVAINPAISNADCDNGSWWDPVANRCQGPVVPDCPGGWWDPNLNKCRPPVATVPLNCTDGSWWDPVNNVCQPPLLPPR